MVTRFNGNCVRIYINANEADSNNRVSITLPDGYSYETIRVLYLRNITEIAPYFYITSGVYHIPPVNSHSPSILQLLVTDSSKDSEIRIIIEKFGQIPDPQYFNGLFKPILVTGDDGKEYKVIPSDQFK